MKIKTKNKKLNAKNIKLNWFRFELEIVNV